MIALMLCCHSIAPSTCKDDVSASAICHVYRFSLVNWCIGRPTQVSSCCFGDLSYNPSFYFAAMTLRQLTVLTSLLYQFLGIIFTARKDSSWLDRLSNKIYNLTLPVFVPVLLLHDCNCVQKVSASHYVTWYEFPSPNYFNTELYYESKKKIKTFTTCGGGGGRVYIHLIVYLEEQQNDNPTLCYHFIAPCTSKGGISASAICYLWGFLLVYSSIIRPNRLPLATVVACSITLHSALLHRG